MFRQVQLKNFRSFEHLQANQLTKINLITGRNGTGKTAILEGLFLNASACRPSTLIPLAGARNEPLDSIMNDAFMRDLYHEFHTSQPAEIQTVWTDPSDGDTYERTLSIATIASSPSASRGRDPRPTAATRARTAAGTHRRDSRAR